MTLPTDYDARKAIPLLTGVIDYFTDALAEIARVSAAGNAQHNPEAHAAGVLFWNRDKSTDEANTLIRHLAERGGFDTDGVRHSAKAAWRALALLQKEIEAATGCPPPRGCTPPSERGKRTEGAAVTIRVSITDDGSVTAEALAQAMAHEGLVPASRVAPEEGLTRNIFPAR
jgi:hypothetical protein